MSKGMRLRRAALLVVSLLVAAGIAEGLLMAMGYEYRPMRIQTIDDYREWRYYHAFNDKHFVYDPDLIWRPRKGSGPITSQGYRGDEIPREKKPGSIRIFAFGDSNTLGWVGGSGPNWPAYLQEILRQENDRYTVVNAGAYGYTSFQGLRRLQEALHWQPDLALISFGMNDSVPVTLSDAEFLSRRFRTLDLDRKLVSFRVGQLALAVSDGLLGRERKELVRRVSIPEYRENLAEMIRLSRERKIQPVLLTRPFCASADGGGWLKNFDPAYGPATIEVARQHGALVIDVQKYFQDRRELFEDVTHFTEEGHRLMAELVAERIRPLLPGGISERR